MLFVPKKKKLIMLSDTARNNTGEFVYFQTELYQLLYKIFIKDM